MKKLLVLLFFSVLFSAVKVSAYSPWLKLNKIYNATTLVYDGKKVPYNGAICMANINGTNTIIIKGVDEDEKLSWTLRLKSDFKRDSTDDGDTVYIAQEQNKTGVLIGTWPGGKRIILFDFEGENLGVIFDSTPFSDLND